MQTKIDEFKWCTLDGPVGGCGKPCRFASRVSFVVATAGLESLSGKGR